MKADIKELVLGIIIMTFIVCISLIFKEPVSGPQELEKQQHVLRRYSIGYNPDAKHIWELKHANDGTAVSFKDKKEFDEFIDRVDLLFKNKE